ncbi:hypothetical protein AAG570_003821 [Ranatra chinensis]|uniref:Peptidase A2 domain-containing protein n=1 Tax=Ranatra chinensis TaxID=642074 RepID=A0ABD0Y1Y7_9HEMI
MPVTLATENLLVDLLTKLLTHMDNQERQDQRRRPSSRSWNRLSSRSPSASKLTYSRCFYRRKLERTHGNAYFLVHTRYWKTETGSGQGGIHCPQSTVVRLFLRDLNSRTNFLVDTGASISALPRRGQTTTQSGTAVYAANETKINTNGTITALVNFGLQHPFRWTYILADIQHPIIDADFLTNFGLLVDLRRTKFVDEETGLATRGKSILVATPTIHNIPVMGHMTIFSTSVRRAYGRGENGWAPLSLPLGRHCEDGRTGK